MPATRPAAPPDARPVEAQEPSPRGRPHRGIGEGHHQRRRTSAVVARQRAHTLLPCERTHRGTTSGGDDMAHAERVFRRRHDLRVPLEARVHGASADRVAHEEALAHAEPVGGGLGQGVDAQPVRECVKGLERVADGPRELARGVRRALHDVLLAAPFARRHVEAGGGTEVDPVHVCLRVVGRARGAPASPCTCTSEKVPNSTVSSPAAAAHARCASPCVRRRPTGGATAR